MLNSEGFYYTRANKMNPQASLALCEYAAAGAVEPNMCAHCNVAEETHENEDDREEPQVHSGVEYGELSYQIVCDEELEELAADGMTKQPCEAMNAITPTGTFPDGAKKIHLRLSASKISLKSQTRNKINKSMQSSTTLDVAANGPESEMAAIKTKDAKVLTAATMRRAVAQPPPSQQQQHQQRHPQRQRNVAPLNFKISPVPIAPNGNGNGVVDGVAHPPDNVPEIVLTSLYHRQQQQKQREQQEKQQQQHQQSIAQLNERRQRPVAARSPGMVTFRAAKTPPSNTNHSSHNQNNNNNNNSACAVITHQAMIAPVRRPTVAAPPPPLAFGSATEAIPPPPCRTAKDQARRQSAGTKPTNQGLRGAPEITEPQWRCDVDETSDEIHSPSLSCSAIAAAIERAGSGSSSGCGTDIGLHLEVGSLGGGGGGSGGGSSTSPESLVDNILSAASSVSVRSSSESSLVRIPPPPTPTDACRVIPFASLPPTPPPAASLPAMPPVTLALPAAARLTPRRRLSVANGECAGGGVRSGSAGGGGGAGRPQPEAGRRRASTIVAAAHRRSVRHSVNRPLNSKINEPKIPACLAATLAPFKLATPTTLQSSTPVAHGAALALVTPIPKPPPVVLYMPTPTEPHETQTQPLVVDLVGPTNTRSPSPSGTNISIRTATSVNDVTLYPADLKCPICQEVYTDPRTLHCLHTFCFRCLVEENFKADASLAFWTPPINMEDRDVKVGGPALHTNGALHERQIVSHVHCKSDSSIKSEYSLRSISPDVSPRSGSDSPSTPSRASSRRSSFNFLRKQSLERILLRPKSAKTADAKASESPHIQRRSNVRLLLCKVCQFTTELPQGGLRQLPQNFVLTHKIDEFRLKVSDEIMQIWCGLCNDEANAIYHCVNCSLSLCMLCKEAHERQRTTAKHKINYIVEMRRNRKMKDNAESLAISEASKINPKCSLHGGIEVRAFCGTCLQVACSDCLVLLHKGHRTEPICRAIKSYSRILADSMEQTRPLCLYAEQSIERLNEIAKDINRKCDDIETQLEDFMKRYFEALESHRKILTQQIRRARETKMEMIVEQQADMVRRSNESSEAVRFAQELGEYASDAEMLSFVNVLLKRFEYCQRFRSPVDPKISDIINFLPQTQAPSAKSQHGIPLYGIITLQVVDPLLCTLEWEGFSELRIHRKIEFVMHARDSYGMSLCHGGLLVRATVHYKGKDTKSLDVEIFDGRDGTYSIAFTPDSYGNLILAVTIHDKHIKDSPFNFVVRMVHPHSGTFHCCAFCSSKGNRQKMECACAGRMPQTNGCGHGHTGHPGRRHWSCCGSVVHNSECLLANKTLNS